MADWRRLLPRLVPWAWSLGLALLLLGPALGRGYVLSYDMVWVPDLALTPDVLGLGSGLPRAVPSDAVVAALDELVPGMLLQKLVLLLVLVLGGVGAARLVDRTSLVAQLVAVALYEWNPFVAERLLIGHWPVLVAYAALPWVILAAQRWRTTGRFPARLCWLVLLGSLSASAGVVTAVALLVFAATRSARRLLLTGGLVAAANAPWIVSGLLHAGSAVTDSAGAEVFALHGEGSVPGPLAALTLGGIWNSEVVPHSRTGVAGWATLVVLLALVALGARRWAARVGRRDAIAFGTCWLVGWGVAVLTWAVPGQVGWVAAHVPGAGLLRDGSRMLVLCAPLLVAVAAQGAARLYDATPRGVRPTTLVALLLVPVALMPDVALGFSGRLTPVAFPADYARARAVVDEAGGHGDVLLLPLSSYRQPGWNHDHKVLDPAGRFLGRDFVAGDDLFVSGVRVAGEDPRARDAGRVLARPTPEQRSQGLAELGIGFVVTERDAGAAPVVQGTALMRGEDLSVQRLSEVSATTLPVSWVVAMVAAWLAFVGLLVGGVSRGVVSTLREARNRGRGSAYK